MFQSLFFPIRDSTQLAISCPCHHDSPIMMDVIFKLWGKINSFLSCLNRYFATVMRKNYQSGVFLKLCEHRLLWHTNIRSIPHTLVLFLQPLYHSSSLPLPGNFVLVTFRMPHILTSFTSQPRCGCFCPDEFLLFSYQVYPSLYLVLFICQSQFIMDLIQSIIL